MPFLMPFSCCVYRVTVGVVIGVADLIVPETNVGEVGRETQRHSTVPLVSI